jgi:hypothetical protein
MCALCAQVCQRRARGVQCRRHPTPWLTSLSSFNAVGHMCVAVNSQEPELTLSLHCCFEAAIWTACLPVERSAEPPTCISQNYKCTSRIEGQRKALANCKSSHSTPGRPTFSLPITQYSTSLPCTNLTHSPGWQQMASTHSQPTSPPQHHVIHATNCCPGAHCECSPSSLRQPTQVWATCAPLHWCAPPRRPPQPCALQATAACGPWPPPRHSAPTARSATACTVRSPRPRFRLRRIALTGSSAGARARG